MTTSPFPLPRFLRRLLVPAAVAGFVLFFVPIPSSAPPLGWGVMLSEAYHALYFAFLVFVLLARAPLPGGRRGGLAAFLLASATAVVVELVQPAFGRSCELSDFVVGATAAAVSAAVFSARLPFPRRAVLAAAAGLVLLFSPVAARYVLLARPARALFPRLYVPGELCFSAPWDFHGVALAADGTVTADGTEAEYPGLFRLAARGDWRAFSALALRVEWDGPEGAVGVLRADPADKRDPAYDERLQREVALSRGGNDILLPLDASRVDLSRMGPWGFFLVSPPPFHYFRLIDARLLPPGASESEPP